jgi:hypothetical protein
MSSEFESAPTKKATNWKVIIPIVIVIILCCLCAVIAGVLYYMGTQGTGPVAPYLATDTPIPSPTPELTIEGDWMLYFDWDCTGDYGSTGITFMGDGRYVMEGGGVFGTWSLSGDYVDFTFDDSPYSRYVGTVDNSGTYMEGTMDNTDNMTGCWYAER